jgi:hypothetical protein
MPEINENQREIYSSGITKELEEKQRLLKDRLLLVGQNLIEFKEKYEEEILELKKDMQEIKQTLEKLTGVIESLSGEIPKLAKKEELQILAKQAKMFQPLEFVKKSDLLHKRVPRKGAEKLKKK